MIRVALLDEHELVRIGLKTVLKQDSAIDVVVDSGDLTVFFKLVRSAHPDLLLIDVSEKPEASPTGAGTVDASNQSRKSTGYRLIESLRATDPELKVIVMSTVFDLDCLLQSLCGKVDGYLLKNASPEELVTAVHATIYGGVYIHAKLTEYVPGQLLRGRVEAKLPQSSTPLLSEREQDVMDLLVKGHTNREISEKLYLSPKTVEAYRAKIYMKFGVKTRADLFSYAVNRGLVAF